MIYKVTVTGSRGNEEVYFMSGETLESMTSGTIVKVEEIPPPSEKVNEKPPNKDDDNNWSYHNRVF
jgi:hypothetical protein